MEVHVCKIFNFVLQSASGRPSLVYKGRFPDPRLRDEDRGWEWHTFIRLSVRADRQSHKSKAQRKQCDTLPQSHLGP